VKRLAFFFPLLLAAALALGSSVDEYAAKVAPLIDPAKLATLGTRGANPRVQKITYWLATAKAEGVNTAKVADAALKSVGMTNAAAAKLTKAAMLRNVTIADRLGCLDKPGLDEMRKGNAATVQRGPYTGDQLSVDHVIPRAVVPELDNVIANLELMPQRANSRKNSNIGVRQRDLAEKLNSAGLLSSAGLRAVRVRP
jgi:hypothetical protein